MMVHNFNPSTGKAEAGGTISLRSACSTEQVQDQQNLGSEGNNHKEKAGEDVIEQWGHIRAPERSRTW